MSSDSTGCGGPGRRKAAAVAAGSRVGCAVVRAAALSALLGAGAAGAGCAPVVVSVTADAEPAGTSYAKTFDRYTRVTRIGSVDDLDTPIIIGATLRARAFQRAYAEHYLKAYKINIAAERDKILERERLAADLGLSFWVRTTFHNYQWNDLRPAAGKWRLVVVDESGQETPAATIEPLASRDLTVPVLLGEPLDVYSKLWLVRFPQQREDGQPLVPAGARKIILRAAGPVGQTDLTWLLQ